MTVSIAWPYGSGAYNPVASLAGALPQRILGGAAVACVGLACAWTICINLGGGQTDDVAAARTDRLAFAASRANKLAVVRAPAPGLASANIDVRSFDARFSAGFAPGVSLQGEPPAGESHAEPTASVQPADSRSRGRRLARSESPAGPRSSAARGRQRGGPAVQVAEQQTALASPPSEQPTLFQKLFGMPTASPAIFEKLFGPSPAKVTLAYAGPDGGLAGDGASVSSGLFDRQTAVYDISAHMVYLPDGTALEAHSGIGERIDDPRYTAEKDRGPTPPNMYDLRPRERLFHGVQALRLLPEDESKVFGRSGLLAHTYMLGPSGQSNGCVSFKDYDKFLQAYENHEITRLAVVARVN